MLVRMLRLVSLWRLFRAVKMVRIISLMKLVKTLRLVKFVRLMSLSRFVRLVKMLRLRRLTRCRIVDFNVFGKDVDDIEVVEDGDVDAVCWVR